MIVRARVPLRLGLAGGGTDLSPYCDRFGGAVLNATIDRYAYAIIEDSPDGLVRFTAPDLQVEETFEPNASRIASARLRLHAGALLRISRQFCEGQVRPVHITSFVDAPAGSGLGSSSALVVALVEAWRTWLGLPLGRYDVAHMAFEIERLELGLAGGKQDQYAAAFGGVNFIEFLAEDRVIVNPLRVPQYALLELESSLITCFTGVSRSSEQIIEEQQRRMQPAAGNSADRVAGGAAGPTGGDAVQQDAGGTNLESLHQLKQDAGEMKEALLRGQVGRMAQILNRSWLAKKRTAAGVTSAAIESMHEAGMAAGAIGAKVSGAGGGGFMMFVVAPQRRTQVIRALNDAGGTAASVHLTTDGAESWTLP